MKLPNGCTCSLIRNVSINKCARFFGYSERLSRYPYVKLEKLKICKMCCVNSRHRKNMLTLKLPDCFCLSLSLSCFDKISRKSMILYQCNPSGYIGFRVKCEILAAADKIGNMEHSGTSRTSKNIIIITAIYKLRKGLT